VLELEASMAKLVRYHRHRDDVFVLPGIEGQYLPGLRVKAIHWNRRFIRNYMALHDAQARKTIAEHGGVFEACCGGRRQVQDFQTCGAWSKQPWSDSRFTKVGQYYMCNECKPRWV